MPERTKTTDRLPSPERIQYQEGLVGLQARLLIGGEALNPNKLNLSPVTNEALGNFEARNYSPFNTASTGERKDYWEGKENNDFQQQKTRWVSNIVSLFDTNKSFFSQDQEGKEWSELFSKIGINTQSFTQQNAEALYNKYFSGEKKTSNIKKFISDIVSAYRKPDGKIDYQKLKKNLNCVQWLAHIFGDISSEVVSQLLDAEVKLQTQPEELINKANQQEKNALRLNNLLPKEKELLAFLSSAPIEKAPPPVQKKDQESEGRRFGDFLLTYFRPGDPRIFPERFSAFQLLAKDIKEAHPQEFANYDIAALAKTIQGEIDQIQQELNQFGLTHQELHNLTLHPIEEQILNNYRHFIQNTYGVNLPSTEKLHVIPIKGALSKLINPSGRALAFVNTTAPFIFLDFDAIERLAHAKGYAQGWRVMKRHEFGELVKTLLAEIQPHEYTHILADLAYWNFYHIDEQGKKELAKAMPGKVGLQLAKPKDIRPIPQGLELEESERGRGLMEALTVELTAKWAASNNQRLDIPAYAGEREILYELQNMLLREDGMPEGESLRQFVHGYFTRDGFRKFVEMIDGFKRENGRFTSKRPHLTSIVYALMEYEAKKRGGTGASIYPLTYYFLQKRLSAQHKQEIFLNLDQLHLPPKIKEQLKKQLS